MSRRRTLGRRLHRPAWGSGAVAAFAVLTAAAAPAAHALLTASADASLDVATAVLAPPSSVDAAAGSCEPGVSDAAVVSWTPTPSAWASGYEILRSTSSAGPYAVVGTVAGAATTSYSDAPLQFETAYYYRVRAVRHEWQSVATAPVERVTRTSACA